VVDDVRHLGHQPLDVFRVAVSILGAGDVILAPAVRVVVERDDAIAGIGDEKLDDVRAYMARSAGHQNRAIGHDELTRSPVGQSSDT
jgi:hypothetical protein